MELNIISLDNKAKGKKKLPTQFAEPVRTDLIKRAVHTIQSNKRQPYGAYDHAGQGHAARTRKRRRRYRGSYGIGIARVTRKVMSRRGSRFTWTGAVAPGTVGGRRAFPPLADKKWNKKINDKERRKAIRSALAAVMQPELVKERGHKIPEAYPFIIDDSIETLEKTKKVKQVLQTLGLTEELARASIKKVRAGKGTMRSRKYKTKKGPLLVVADKCKLLKTAQNIPGIEVITINKINAELLAPGAHPGRATLFTEGAITKLEKDKLFM